MSRLLQLVLAFGLFSGVVLCSEPRVTLHSRQNINVPPACESNSGCMFVTPFLAAQNCTADQCCTDTFVTGLRDCFLCVGTTTGIQNYSQPQQTLDEFVNSCDAQNHTVTPVTLPGEDNGRSSSSFNPSTLRSTNTQTQPTTTPSNPTQSPPPSQTTNAAGIPAHGDINTKGLGVIPFMLWALARVIGLF